MGFYKDVYFYIAIIFIILNYLQSKMVASYREIVTGYEQMVDELMKMNADTMKKWRASIPGPKDE